MQPGNHIPDLVFLRPDGNAVKLHEFLGQPGAAATDGPRTLLVVFLRHLA